MPPKKNKAKESPLKRMLESPYAFHWYATTSTSTTTPTIQLTLLFAMLLC
jgi:hypothetical protein